MKNYEFGLKLARQTRYLFINCDGPLSWPVIVQSTWQYGDIFQKPVNHGVWNPEIVFWFPGTKHEL